MDAFFHHKLVNDFVSLHECAEKATKFLDSHSVDERTVFLVNFGLEEMVTNAVKYGYAVPGTNQIEVTLKLHAKEIEVIIIDDGHPFDPVAQETKPSATNIEEREIGGLGIHLCKKLMDRLHYRREQGRNIVEIAIRRDVTPSSD